jgi:hypothetical protein
MNNIKTTITGVLSILIAVASGALSFLKTGQIPELAPIISAITAGVGLILAKDASK